MKLSRAFYIGCIIIFTITFILEIVTQVGTAAECNYEQEPNSTEIDSGDVSVVEYEQEPRNAWHLDIIRLNMPEFFTDTGGVAALNVSERNLYVNSSSKLMLWTVSFTFNDSTTSHQIEEYPSTAVKNVNIATKVFLIITTLLCLACLIAAIVSCVKEKEYGTLNGCLIAIHWLFLIISATLYTVFVVQNMRDAESQSTFGYAIYLIWTAFFFSMVAVITVACIVTAYMEKFDKDNLFKPGEGGDIYDNEKPRDSDDSKKPSKEKSEKSPSATESGNKESGDTGKKESEESGKMESSKKDTNKTPASSESTGIKAEDIPDVKGHTPEAVFESTSSGKKSSKKTSDKSGTEGSKPSGSKKKSESTKKSETSKKESSKKSGTSKSQSQTSKSKSKKDDISEQPEEEEDYTYEDESSEASSAVGDKGKSRR